MLCYFILFSVSIEVEVMTFISERLYFTQKGNKEQWVSAHLNCPSMTMLSLPNRIPVKSTFSNTLCVSLISER